MDLHFRNAVAADIPAIVALVESAYRGEVSRAGWTTEADFLDGQRIDDEGVAADIGKTGSVIVLAEQNGQLLACCHLENTSEVCYFGMFSVAPHLQGDGIGKQLMQEAERMALAWQCTAMEMTVIDIRDELIAFYEGKTAKWQVPDDVVFVDAIPLGATGKMLKTRLREQLKDYKLPSV